ncbi:MAG: patatin-like phospholipase family protein [Pseudomonadota bacterium]
MSVTDINSFEGYNSQGPAALVLSGGGARAAYQIGVLRAISEMLPSRHSTPFPIICGTSAGALNAAALATCADSFGNGVDKLHDVWSNFSSAQVYRTDWPGVLGSAMRWLSNLAFGLFNKTIPVSLLNNAPLAQLLREIVDLKQLPRMIDEGHLHALCITACSYSRGDSVNFYQGVSQLSDWQRARRRGRRTLLSHEHLMASSAIPLIFPAVDVAGEYYGDGALRQLAPISPALHLGASRILVIGAGTGAGSAAKSPVMSYPSLAQIIGHIMSSSFIDSLEMDLERMHRINHTVSILPQELLATTPLKPVKYMVISPQLDKLEVLAARYAHTLPASIQLFVRGSGMFKKSGSNLLSYLIFEAPFTQALIDLGYTEAKEREVELRAFLQPGIELDAEVQSSSTVLNFRRPPQS